MGGYVAAAASARLQTEGLFLMAPAFGVAGYPDIDPPPRAKRICIVHGWDDDIIPVANSIGFAQRYKAELHLVNDSHRLIERLPLIERIFESFLKDIL
jgi:predicted esterase